MKLRRGIAPKGKCKGKDNKKKQSWGDEALEPQHDSIPCFSIHTFSTLGHYASPETLGIVSACGCTAWMHACSSSSEVQSQSEPNSPNAS